MTFFSFVRSFASSAEAKEGKHDSEEKVGEFFDILCVEPVWQGRRESEEEEKSVAN